MTSPGCRPRLAAGPSSATEVTTTPLIVRDAELLAQVGRQARQSEAEGLDRVGGRRAGASG